MVDAIEELLSEGEKGLWHELVNIEVFVGIGSEEARGNAISQEGFVGATLIHTNMQLASKVSTFTTIFQFLCFCEKITFNMQPCPIYPLSWEPT